MLVTEDAIFQAEPTQIADWSRVEEGQHVVQFYEGDAYLVRSVASYISAGLNTGEVAVVIASPRHLAAIEESLQADGIIVGDLQAEGRFFQVNAAEQLAAATRDGVLDEARLAEIVIGIVGTAGQRNCRLRIFGELVALLWADGKIAAAKGLENVWNELAAQHRFSLLCAYPMRAFQGTQHGQHFADICTTHSHVIPTESYLAQTSPEARLRAVGFLQQQAGSLQREVMRRRQAERAVHTEQTKLDMAVAIAGLGIWELDLATRTFTCSVECKAKLGVASDEALSYERFWSLVHPADRSRAESAFREAITSNTDYSAEFRVATERGRERWIACLGRCSQNGEGHRLLGVIQDVTERKRALQLLEQKVAERTSELQEALAELEAFSYSITHDMRAPLRAMQGFATAVIEDHAKELKPEGLNYLELIRRAAHRLDLLIRDVLCYSKVAKAKLQLKPIALGPFVQSLLSQWPEFLKARHSIHVQSPLHTVTAHEALLTQCLTNLIGNALKFMPRGRTPNVRIRTEKVGDKVSVSVIDNGVGIHPKDRNKIFKIFSRIYSDEVYAGTGIGLAIVKKAVARMGGECGFDSEPGRGSSFWFTLRAA